MNYWLFIDLKLCLLKHFCKTYKIFAFYVHFFYNFFLFVQWFHCSKKIIFNFINDQSIIHHLWINILFVCFFKKHDETFIFDAIINLIKSFINWWIIDKWKLIYDWTNLTTRMTTILSFHNQWNINQLIINCFTFTFQFEYISNDKIRKLYQKKKFYFSLIQMN